MANVAQADFRNVNADPSLGQPLSIFISYPTENHKIAQTIEQALLQFDRSKFKVFLDRSNIVDGRELRVSIVEALERAVYSTAEQWVSPTHLVALSGGSVRFAGPGAVVVTPA